MQAGEGQERTILKKLCFLLVLKALCGSLSTSVTVSSTAWLKSPDPYPTPLRGLDGLDTSHRLSGPLLSHLPKTTISIILFKRRNQGEIFFRHFEEAAKGVVPPSLLRLTETQ